jgi:site-specific recombinase XerD
MAHDHLQRALRGSKWEVMTGWHCMRHAFVSACAVRGVDQRILEEWAGHGSETISRIYRHLAPNAQAEAFKSVFQ